MANGVVVSGIAITVSPERKPSAGPNGNRGHVWNAVQIRTV